MKFNYDDMVQHNAYGKGKVVKIFDNDDEPIYGVDFKYQDTTFVPMSELVLV